MDPETVIVTALVTGAFTAVLNWFVQRDVMAKVETRKRLEDARVKAYSDLVAELLRFMFATARNDAEAIAAVTPALVDARARVSLFGSRAVLAAMGQPGEWGQERITELVGSMRADFTARNDAVAGEVIARALYVSTPKGKAIAEKAKRPHADDAAS